MNITRPTGEPVSDIYCNLLQWPVRPAASRTVVQQAVRELGYRIGPVLAALSAHRCWSEKGGAATAAQTV